MRVQRSAKGQDFPDSRANLLDLDNCKLFRKPYATQKHTLIQTFNRRYIATFKEFGYKLIMVILVNAED